MKDLIISSKEFKHNGLMGIDKTGFGEDQSPEFNIDNVENNVCSIAIIMDDLDVPFVKEYTHWIIWNIPVTNYIKSNISKGDKVEELGNAIQGIAWGKHCYRGPKQPPFIRKTHRYRFSFYALDCFLDLNSNNKKTNLLNAMTNHIIQTGEIIGIYKR